MEQREVLKEAVIDFISERLDGRSGPLTIDIVNLDRDGKGGLVYLNGCIVKRQGSGELLDGLARLTAVQRAGVGVEMRMAEVGDDPVEGAIYVPPGPTPDYVVDRATRTILIGIGRNNRDGEVTLDELRDTATRALSNFYGN